VKSANLNLSGKSFMLDSNGSFLNNVQIPPDSGQSGSDIGLFDVTLSNRSRIRPEPMNEHTVYSGGVDSNAQDVLNSTGFSVTESNGISPVPELSSTVLLGGWDRHSCDSASPESDPPKKVKLRFSATV
jgi:hypothetical protein